MPDSPIQFVFMLFADDVFDPIIQFIQSTVKGFHCLVSNISHSSICSLFNGKAKIDLGGNTVVIDRLKKKLTIDFSCNLMLVLLTLLKQILHIDALSS